MVVFDMPLASGRLAQDRCSKEKAWHARLQIRLQRPYQGADEGSQCERREDRACRIGRGVDCDHRNRENVVVHTPSAAIETRK